MPRRWTCPAGLLVYAEGNAEGGSSTLDYRVRHAGKHFHVVTLDLAGPIPCLEGELHALAAKVRGLRQTTQRSQTAKAARMAQVAHRR